ncbi:MAG: class I SAM-dependent methyltransferase [Acidobacteriota bacterium]
MDNLVRGLAEDAWVVDIGAGPGSFDYGSTRAHVLSIDLAFPDVSRHKDGSALSPADRLPLPDEVADVVVCNHSLEHFPNPGTALAEVDRVLKPKGLCWIAIPDGHSYSGFVYQVPASRERLRHYPQPARALFSAGPSRVVRFFARWLAHLTRLTDRLLGTHASRYGWGFVLQKSPVGPAVRRMPHYVNVCIGCGAGHPTETLVPERGRLGLVSSYRCPSCGTRNLFVRWADQPEGAGKI